MDNHMVRVEIAKKHLDHGFAEIHQQEKISKAQFEHLKKAFNTYVRELWDVEVQNLVIGKTNEHDSINEVYWVNTPESHTFASAEKKLKAILSGDVSPIAKQAAEKGLAVLSEQSPLLDRVMACKALIGQRGTNAPSRTAPAIPYATSKAIKAVKVMLENMASKERDELIKENTTAYEIIIAAYERISDDAVAEFHKDKNDYRKLIVAFYMEKEQGAIRMTRKSNASQLMLEDATKRAQLTIDTYITKMQQKLGVLIDVMGEPSEIKAYHSGRAGQLEGSLHVHYVDGRSYIAETSVVWSHSVNGSPFTRFPCLFKQIHGVDGVLVKRSMSEAQIIEWAKSN